MKKCPYKITEWKITKKTERFPLPKCKRIKDRIHGGKPAIQRCDGEENCEWYKKNMKNE